MRERIRKTTNWLKKFGSVWKSLEVFDTALGLWARLPAPIRWAIHRLSGWAISTVLAYLAVVTGWIDEFGPPILIAVAGGLVIGTVLSAIIYVIGNRLALAISQRTIPEGYRLVPRDAQVHHKRALRGEQPAATGTVTVSEPDHAPQDEPAMRVETRGLESFPLHPKGYGWLIPSVTITNPTDEKVTVDATLVIDGRRLTAAREEEVAETKARPPRSTESRLLVPVDVPPRGVVHGSLMFVMTAAAYENLPSEIRSTLSLATKVLEIKDLLSGAVERIKLGPENQTIIVQFPKLPQPSRWHRFKRKLAAFWNWLRD